MCILMSCTNLLGGYAAQAQTDEPVIGRVVAWGAGALGQTNLPPGLTNVVAIAAGSVHSLALRSDGTVRAWGGGSRGETNVPPGLSNVIAIAAAGFYGNNYGYSLALKSDGTVVGWGALNLPSGLSNVVAIAAGAYWWMALKSDGTVTANYPYLVNGLLPLGGEPLSNVVAVAAGGRHLLALTRLGTIVGWGLNNDGQATGTPSGNFTYTNGIVTLGGQPMSGAISIAAGFMHSMALKSDGTVIVWGNGNRGQTLVPLGLKDVDLQSVRQPGRLLLRLEGVSPAEGLDSA
jgi:alpha-tubulin suppressor-like RCC1 family protein